MNEDGVDVSDTSLRMMRKKKEGAVSFQRREREEREGKEGGGGMSSPLQQTGSAHPLQTRTTWQQRPEKGSPESNREESSEVGRRRFTGQEEGESRLGKGKRSELVRRRSFPLSSKFASVFSL